MKTPFPFSFYIKAKSNILVKAKKCTACTRLTSLSACGTLTNMVKSKYTPIIKQFIKSPVFSVSEARKAGIPHRMLAYFHKAGIIERISRGIYTGSEAELDIEFRWEDLALIAMSVPKGIICLISALCYYDMTDQLMREFWIAIPNASRAPKRPNTMITRMRNTTLGVTNIKIGDYRVKIFDRERTVIDAFRFLSIEIAIKALRFYLFPIDKKNKPDMNKLAKYADKLRVNISPYVMALTT